MKLLAIAFMIFFGAHGKHDVKPRPVLEQVRPDAPNPNYPRRAQDLRAHGR